MSAAFDRKIQTTLADANLQLAIFTATARLKQHRIDNVAGDVLPGNASDAVQLKRHCPHPSHLWRKFHSLDHALAQRLLFVGV